LDGVVCAMHAESQVDAEAVGRLSRASTWDVAEISKRLSAPPNPILGSRRLLHHYRDFVKWDPADDLCDDCTVLVTPASRLTCTVVVMPWATKQSAGPFRVADVSLRRRLSPNQAVERTRRSRVSTWPMSMRRAAHLDR
jgi:hypothetical protein